MLLQSHWTKPFVIVDWRTLLTDSYFNVSVGLRHVIHFLFFSIQQYVNVRRQACVTARDLRSTNQAVLENLLRLSTFDPDGNVKV